MLQPEGTQSCEATSHFMNHDATSSAGDAHVRIALGCATVERRGDAALVPLLTEDVSDCERKHGW